MLNTEQRIIFLGPQKRLFRKRIPRRIFICRDRFEVEAAMGSRTNKGIWVSFTRDFTDILLKHAVESRRPSGVASGYADATRRRAFQPCSASSIRHSAWARNFTGSPKTSSSRPL